MRKVIYILLISLLLNLNANAASFNCHYGYKNKNNLIRYDVFASAYIEVNSFFKKLTFFGLKMEHMKRNEGIKFDTVNLTKTRKGFRSEKFKQSRLTEKDKDKLKDGREYLWPDVKDEFLKFYIDVYDNNPFILSVETADLRKKWRRTYQCYKPR